MTLRRFYEQVSDVNGDIKYLVLLQEKDLSGAGGKLFFVPTQGQEKMNVLGLFHGVL